MIKNILILCLGNICRSPIAEALFIARFTQEGLGDIVVSSAGLGAFVDKPADEIGQALMLEKGFNISAHRARIISQDILFGSDLILTMSTDQQKQVKLNYPAMCGRVHRLGKWGGYDVPDPYLRPKLIFEQALALIEQGVHEWYMTLWGQYVKKDQDA